MINSQPFIRWIKIPLLATALLTGPVAAAPNLEQEAELTKQIKQAYANGSLDQFNRLLIQLPAKSVFRPYADIWQFRFLQKGQSAANDSAHFVWNKNDVTTLLRVHENSWPAETLRRDWLEQLAIAGRWADFEEQRSQLRYRPDQGVECADLMFAAERGQLVRYKLNAVLNHDKRLPRTCRVLLQNLYQRGAVTPLDLDKHVFHLAANNQLTNAIQFVDDMGELPWAKQLNTSTLRSAMFNPDSFLKSSTTKDHGSDLYVTLALARKAVQEHAWVASQIERERYGALSNNSAQLLWAHVGYRAGLVWDRNALSYFRRSNPEVMNGEQQEWYVRSALLLEDWNAVLQATNSLSADLAEERTWVYWRGRALAAQSKMVEARQEWIKIANPFSFYGKLAFEELGEVVAAPKRPELLTAAELDKAKKNPGLIRALALYDAGLRTEGFWEFNLQVAQMNDRDLLAAASWAEKNQLYDRAIAAADRTENEHDLALRYLTPFRDNMKAKTSEIGVDESWVYGLIRQESRFVTIARSGVGASGLMQVMPATAKYVAKKIGMSGFKPADITEIETNLTLGTSYLKMVYEQHDQSPVLASAGYNAGPSRPALWKRRLGDRSIEGALFAELIPFDETRGYVKNVMSNTVAYSLLLNNSSAPLKQRLGIIYGSK